MSDLPNATLPRMLHDNYMRNSIQPTGIKHKITSVGQGSIAQQKQGPERVTPSSLAPKGKFFTETSILAHLFFHFHLTVKSLLAFQTASSGASEMEIVAYSGLDNSHDSLNRLSFSFPATLREL